MGDAKWTFERIQAEVEKVAYNTPPYKGNKAVTAFQAEQLMGLVRNDMQATIDALEAKVTRLTAALIAACEALLAMDETGDDDE